MDSNYKERSGIREEKSEEFSATLQIVGSEQPRLGKRSTEIEMDLGSMYIEPRLQSR